MEQNLEEKLETLTSVIHRVMTRNLETRNNDNLLIFEVLREMGFNVPFKDEEIKQMPNFWAIRRIRQDIQSPTGENILHGSREVMDKRARGRSEYKEHFTKGRGYSSSGVNKNGNLDWGDL